ncbi:DUF2934 domain-containing protein [Aureimonas fodinaquatilis]|nr:DUF2934 domain-containing protein [Aureimonas fodinaquatilis]
MGSREELIRQRAHEIWEDAGCPEGQANVHWDQATAEIVAAEGSSGSPKFAEDDLPEGLIRAPKGPNRQPKQTI